MEPIIRKRRDANPMRVEHDEASWQAMAVVADQHHDASAERRARGYGIADEDDAARGMSRRTDELPEVLVLGE